MTVALPEQLAYAREVVTDVLVVGAGPAGLSAAALLAERGLRSIVIDRDSEPGGMPRWCHHSPFGMREFHRILSGRSYGQRLAEAAAKAGASLHMLTTALSLGEDRILAASPEGVTAYYATRILLATGTRETSRAARFIAGERPVTGVMTTGALQYALGRQVPLPFRRPLIVGTELVSLSALLSLDGAGCRPVAMIERALAPLVSPLFMGLPWLKGLPVHYGTDLVAIHGQQQVTGVTLSQGAKTFELDCDGVVLTGAFTPESSLARMSDLLICPKTGGPLVNAEGQTSHPRIYAAGNLLRGVETAGWCWQEGKRIGAAIAKSFEQPDPVVKDMIALVAGEGVRWVMPQRFDPDRRSACDGLQLRLDGHGTGLVTIRSGETRLMQKRVSGGPQKRILLPFAEIAAAIKAAEDRQPRSDFSVSDRRLTVEWIKGA